MAEKVSIKAAHLVFELLRQLGGSELAQVWRVSFARRIAGQFSEEDDVEVGYIAGDAWRMTMPHGDPSERLEGLLEAFAGVQSTDLEVGDPFSSAFEAALREEAERPRGTTFCC